MSNKNKTAGGKRAGSGRKPKDNSRLQLYVSRKSLDEFIRRAGGTHPARYFESVFDAESFVVVIPPIKDRLRVNAKK